MRSRKARVDLCHSDYLRGFSHAVPSKAARIARAVLFWCGIVLALNISCAPLASGSTRTTLSSPSEDSKFYQAKIEPTLRSRCFDCHGDGERKGGVAFDAFSATNAPSSDVDLWWRALRMIRADLMPPSKKPQLSVDEREVLESWIISAVFHANPTHPDPGRVTLRRLNRTEYRWVIQDLLGVEFNADAEFPADDTGHGFDNIADVLTLSPMLLEKYLDAARALVTKAVPQQSRGPAVQVFKGHQLTSIASASHSNAPTRPPAGVLSYYVTNALRTSFSAPQAGRYRLAIDLTATERFVDNKFDYNQCRLRVRIGDTEWKQETFSREANKPFHLESEGMLDAGTQDLVLTVEPLTSNQPPVRTLGLRIDTVSILGALEPNHWVKPATYARFFGEELSENPTPTTKRKKAREVLDRFGRQAFRRPIPNETLVRLVAVAESAYSKPGASFESGVSEAMIAILASPRFLFREEQPIPSSKVGSSVQNDALLDEYALASRLSFFFWSSIPDGELLDLAEKKALRSQFDTQVKRLMANPKSERWIRNFVGQWLQARDVETINIDSRQILSRDGPGDPAAEKRRDRMRVLREKHDADLTDAEKKEMADIRALFAKSLNQPLRAELNLDLRKSMRAETEKTFQYVIEEDRPLIELLESDYAFLNEKLALHYGWTNSPIKGETIRKVALPKDSVRGGILSQGTVLVVTSNPTRTSPVKRGLFVLDNLLGTPPPPPPPNIPALEAAAKSSGQRKLTLRQTLALHREKPLCSSCHDRMDPIGLAMDHFNAMGMWRDQERGEDIDASGKLVTGETFEGVQELKHLLATRYQSQFYRTLIEKLLTYALGRGLEYTDVVTVDQILDRVLESGGKPSVLLDGILHSAPFQRMRLPEVGAGLPKNPPEHAHPH